MDQLHATCDKLFTEVDHLDRIMESDDMAPDRINLALSVAKRVRRDSTLLVRLLASLRDEQLQP
jgi:hypothetical protein